MTKTRTILAAAALALVPALASAECSMNSAKQATMTCAPGTTFDAQTGTCVAEVSS